MQSAILTATPLITCNECIVVGQLFIKNAKKHDAGTYLCIARNGIGRQQTKVISVEVRGKNRLDTELMIETYIGFAPFVHAKYVKSKYVCVTQDFTRETSLITS